MTAPQPRESAPLPPPGSHGDDAARVAAALGLDPATVLDLASSLNPVAPDIRILVATALGSLRRYPDASQATAALAAALGADPECVLLTNGGAEAIALVAGELGRGRVDGPEFGLYRRHLPPGAAGVHDAPLWRSNPNNPTGLLAAPSESAGVWDEAFFQLATGTWTRGDSSTGSIVIGSLTKLFACPGLRLGYVLTADPALRHRLAERQPRWSVSSPAAAVLPKLLELADLPAWSLAVAELRAELCSVLRSSGLDPAPSDANFVLVPHAPGLREQLAPAGVVVRDCASFGLPGAVRIAVPDEPGLERLEGALRAVVAPPSAPAPPPARSDGAAARHRSVLPPIGGALLVCGTSSDAGKSQVVAGLCRLLKRAGVRAAPFKAQNMSLNSFATPSGHEIGRAQGIQALAAGAEPEAAMNPVLLKPTASARSQVVVMGEPLGELPAADYQATRRAALLPVVLEALADLRGRYDVVVCEGAGSPAEINLLEGDIVNLGLAEAAGLPALLVGDIERGGVFASLAGTFDVLPHHLRRHLRAFAINKFRGDPALLGPAIRAIEERTGAPCAGVVPYIEGLHLDAEDSLGLARLLDAADRSRHEASPALLDVAVVALPHLANFTDLDALSIEPGVALRLVGTVEKLGDPDLVILPGSKSTVADLEWLRQSGLAVRLEQIAHDPHGGTILGICAGYQMLGEVIVDEYESRRGRVEALGLLPVVTSFTPEKRTRSRQGHSLTHAVTGYEIRQGDPVPSAGAALVELDDRYGSGPEGSVRSDGRVAGTNLHGLFESDGFRRAWLERVASRRRKHIPASGASFAASREAQIDAVADALAEHLDLDLVWSLVAAGRTATSAVGAPA